MSDPVLEAITALREETARGREQIAANQASIAACQAQIAAVVASLEQHRADDRREMSDLDQAVRTERDRVTALFGWRNWMTGGMAALGLVLVAIGVPVVVATVRTMAG